MTLAGSPLSGDETEFVASARVGHLATTRSDGTPHVVPISPVLDLDRLVFATETNTVKVRNIRANPFVAVCFDEYDEDWSRLWWVRLRGSARIVDDLHAVELLSEKYPQYRECPPNGPVIAVSIDERIAWTASPS